MDNLQQLQQEVANIKSRNRKVEADCGAIAKYLFDLNS